MEKLKNSCLLLKVNQPNDGYLLIQTDKGLIVVSLDEDICIGDSFYYKHFGEDIIETKTDSVNINREDRFFKKIIFAEPKLGLSNATCIKENKKPDPALINSMAVRYRHDFGLLGEEEKDSIRRTMYQLWEEVVGLGFYHKPKQKSYTEEDIEESIRFGFDLGFVSNSSNRIRARVMSKEDFMKSLDNPKVELYFENDRPVKAVIK